MSRVYIIKNMVNGKCYIGSSQEFKKRYERHMRELESRKHHNQLLQKDYDAGHKFEVIKINVKTRDDAYMLEDTLIKEYREKGILYNIGNDAVGGDNLTFHPEREAIIKKIAETVRGWMSKLSDDERKAKFGRRGSDNGMYGKTHTKEVRELLSRINIGRVPPNKGKPMSEEHKAKFMEHVNSRDYTGERNPFHGKTHSDETRRKLSESMSARVIRRPVAIGDEEYPSLQAAGDAMGITPSTVRYRIKTRGPHYRYLNAQRLEKVPED